MPGSRRQPPTPRPRPIRKPAELRRS
jgi:hypothetical protein